MRRILSVHSHASSSAQLYFCFNLKPRGVETLNDNRTATGSTMLTNMRAQFSSPAQYPFGVHCATGIRIITVYSPRNFKKEIAACARQFQAQHSLQKNSGWCTRPFSMSAAFEPEPRLHWWQGTPYTCAALVSSATTCTCGPTSGRAWALKNSSPCSFACTRVRQLRASV